MADKYEITAKHRALFAKLFTNGNDPITFFCRVLADESAPVEQRRDAARTLRPYYHPRLARMGPLLEESESERAPVLFAKQQVWT